MSGSDFPRLVVDNSDSGNSCPNSGAAWCKRIAQSPGILRRRSHPCKETSEAPLYIATRTISGQRSIQKSSMPHGMDKSSTMSSTSCRLAEEEDGRLLGMAVKRAASGEVEAICRRTKEAREFAGFSQSTMATALGLEKQTYAKYENRSAMPFRVLVPFCYIVKRDPTWVLTGERWPDTLHFAPAQPRRRQSTA